MKKISLLFFLCFNLQLFAQKIHLKTGELPTTSNIGEIHDFGQWTEGRFQQQTYCLIQFARSTSASERTHMSAETGIQFFDYIPRWAFIASVPDGIDIHELTKYGVRTIMPYKAQYKVAKQLVERPLPTWIQKGGQQVEILAYTYSNIAPETIVHEMAKNQITFLNWQAPAMAKIEINESQIEEIAKLSWIKLLVATDAPGKVENDQGRTDHRMNTIDADYTTGLHYDGTGVSVAIGDDGGIGPHIDFRGRLFFHPVNMGMGGTHCDHVSGIVGGAGNMNPVMKGNGKGTDLHIYDDYQNLSNAPTHYNTQGVRITSNSLGQGCNDGYNNSAVSADNLINSKYSLMSVHSAGNSGQDNCANVGQGYFTITGGYKAGKNVIAVGNVQKDDVIAPSSSRGPSEDGRLKPEVCAVGTSVNSTQPDDTYDNFTGTSMACPGVAGTLASLWQAYRDTHAGADPNSALMKCLLLNTADDLGNSGPDFIYGFGRVNARRAVKTMNQNQFFIDSVDNAASKTFNINVPAGTKKLKVMLYWHDPAGNPGNAIVLVNNLDIRVIDPTNQFFRPWVLNNAHNVAALSTTAIRSIDSLNNVEQVTIDSPLAGNYTIDVFGTDVPQGPQVFAVTYEIISDSLTMTYPQGGESFANGYTERIRWDAYGNNLGTFTLEYSSDAGANWNVLSNNIAGDRRYYNWTPPANLNTGQMLMRISRGAVSDVSDTLFSVIDIPTGLTVDTACGTDFHLTWNASPVANAYKIYQLGTKYMQEIGTSNTNEFYVTNGVNTTDTFYFAVASMETSNGANGRKCNAYRKLPGDINCLDDAFNMETILPFSTVYPCASSGMVPVKVKIKNIGLKNMVNMPVYYQVNAQPVVNEIVAGPLNIGDSMIYTFTATVNMLNAGTYNIKTWVHTTGDINNNNDTSMATAVVLAPVTFVAPGLVEDFEGPSFPPAGWQVFDYDNSVKWQKIFCISGADPGNTHTAYMDFFNYQSKNAVDDLETPMLDLTGVTADSVFLSFDVAHAYGPLELDTLSLWVSPFCNNSYVPLNYKKWGTDLATVGMMNTIFSPQQTSQWRNDHVDLSAYKGQKVFVRFRGSNKHGNNLYIDNINLELKNAWAVGMQDAEENQCKIYPNPSDGNYVLEIAGCSAEKVQYSIINVAGQIVQSSEISTVQGHVKANIHIEAYPSGYYLLAVRTGTTTQKIKLTKY